MKMMFTAKEIEQLSTEEKLGLTSFGENYEFFYEDISNFVVEGNIYKIIFKSGSVLTTEDKSIFNNVQLGKTRFNLLSKTFNDNKESADTEQIFYSRMATNIDTLYRRLEDENTRRLDVIEKKAHTVLNKIKSDIITPTEELKSIINSIKLEEYKEKMKKLDNILSAFDSLLI